MINSVRATALSQLLTRLALNQATIAQPAALAIT